MMTKLMMTAHFLVFPRIGIGTCICECIQQQYLVLKVSVNPESVLL